MGFCCRICNQELVEAPTQARCVYCGQEVETEWRRDPATWQD